MKHPFRFFVRPRSTAGPRKRTAGNVLADRAATLIVLLAVVAAPAVSSAADAPPVAKDSIPGTTVTFEMIKVPAGKITVTSADGKAREVEIKPVWIGKTEVTWDEYDVFAYQLDVSDQDRRAGVDAESRPSRPYGDPTSGFRGRGRLPAMCVSAFAAERYCQWLSKRTGKTYRLASEAEWEYACRAGGTGEGKLTPGELDKLAWYADNADGEAHPVATKAANAWGFFDMLGNVREWVTGLDGKPITCGGSWEDQAADVGPHVRQAQEPGWTDRDPAYVKSKWWWISRPTLGFRIVREGE